jgi:cell division protein FtsQ
VTVRSGSTLPSWWRTRGLAVVGVVVLAAAAWVVFWSPLLSVRTVDVSGATTLSDQRVLAAAAIEEGTPLARLDLGAVADRVRGIDAVAEVSVVRAWPHGVRIEVTERTAVAVVRAPGGYGLLGDDGTVFRTVPRPRPGLPFLDQTVADGTTDTAAQAALQVAVELPAALSDKVASVSAARPDEVVVRLRSGGTVDWGTAVATERKAEVLLLLLSQRAAHYDVSAPETPTVRQ